MLMRILINSTTNVEATDKVDSIWMNACVHVSVNIHLFSKAVYCIFDITYVNCGIKKTVLL